MKKIGILYICTGPYELFWKDFFISFEKNFLPNTEKHYFVFTDANDIYMGECKRIKKIQLKSLPWPLVTLFRFDTFLSIKYLLRDMDYLMFSNANIKCNIKVNENEFLPNSEIGEKLCFTAHPGYFNKKIYNVPYDRNKKSLAYIPYNCGQNYVIGAMFCGFTDDFLQMCVVLKQRIEEDLKKNVIARWHDESHINRYILDKKNYKLLSPSYCYPVGFELPFPKKLCGVSKQEKFDVNTFKGFYEKAENKKIIKVKNFIKVFLNKSMILWLIDTVLQKKKEEI